jgi:hypothetical protein
MLSRTVGSWKVGKVARFIVQEPLQRLGNYNSGRKGTKGAGVLYFGDNVQTSSSSGTTGSYQTPVTVISVDTVRPPNSGELLAKVTLLLEILCFFLLSVRFLLLDGSNVVG